MACYYSYSSILVKDEGSFWISTNVLLRSCTTNWYVVEDPSELCSLVRVLDPTLLQLLHGGITVWLAQWRHTPSICDMWNPVKVRYFGLSFFVQDMSEQQSSVIYRLLFISITIAAPSFRSHFCFYIFIWGVHGPNQYVAIIRPRRNDISQEPIPWQCWLHDLHDLWKLSMLKVDHFYSGSYRRPKGARPGLLLQRQ